MVIYLAGVTHDAKGSVLMELEKAGRTWKPELKQLARNVLLQRFTQGVVDELLPYERKVSYEDLSRAASGDGGAEQPSILKGIFHDASGSDGLLAMAGERRARRRGRFQGRDAGAREAAQGATRIGLGRCAHRARAVTLRHVLANEFRLDLSCEAPESLQSVDAPRARTKRRCEGRSLPAAFAAVIPDHTDPREPRRDRAGPRSREPSRRARSVPSTPFASKSALLKHAEDLIAKGEFETALGLVADREQSFWLDREVARKAQWEAVRRMAELGEAAKAQVRASIARASGDVGVVRRIRQPLWYGVVSSDQAQRRLESWVSNLDDEAEERPLALVRRACETSFTRMAEGFSKALSRAGWSLPEVLHQTRIWARWWARARGPSRTFWSTRCATRWAWSWPSGSRRAPEVSVRAGVRWLPTSRPSAWRR
ncbi:MAG: hypothetical protein R3A48_04010 [Polyangiales bacterium]